MDTPKIPELSQLLSNYLGRDKTITDHETSRLTAIGENYGSQMFALKISIKNQNQNEILEAVAKIPPPGEFMQRMFNIPVTFRNEIDFYQVIIPELVNFLRERGIEGYLDCFPEFFGSRLSLNPDKKEVDDDAALVLENLKIQGYEMSDRNTGFDLDASRILIKALAKYHAVPLAMKILKPEDFNRKIAPFFKPYRVFEFNEEMTELVFKKNCKIIEQDETVKQYTQRVLDAFKKSEFFLPKNDPKFLREPFSTIIHTDAWVNNFMVQYRDNKPINCKIVDFQLDEYGSPARDLIFFIFTSVQIPVVEQYYDELVQLYHRTLVDDLVKFGCDPSLFSFENFQSEIEWAVKTFEFFHCMIMCEPLFATKDSLKELDEYTDEDMTREKPVPPKHRERAAFIVRECVKRNWI